LIFKKCAIKKTFDKECNFFFVVK